MKNVLCFGDSNTYGYDPAGMRDGTAPAGILMVIVPSSFT